MGLCQSLRISKWKSTACLVFVALGLELGCIWVADSAFADDAGNVSSANVAVGAGTCVRLGAEAEPSMVSVTVPSALMLPADAVGNLGNSETPCFSMVNQGSADVWVAGWQVSDGLGMRGCPSESEALAGGAGAWWLQAEPISGGESKVLSVSQTPLDAASAPVGAGWIMTAGGMLELAVTGHVQMQADSMGEAARISWVIGCDPKESADVQWVVKPDANTPTAERTTVTFDLNLPGSASSGYAVQVEHGSVAARPTDDPTAQDADGAPLTFAGWCVDPQGRERWDFSQPVEDDLTLYASWLNGFAYAVEVDGSQLWFVRAGDLYQASERALSVSGGFEMTAVYGPGSYYNPNGDPGLDFERHAWAGRPLDDAFPAYGAVEVPWLQDGAASEIERVVFADEVAPASCAGWFSGMDAIAGIEGLDLLNTTHAVSLRSLFEGCSGLERIDLAGWDTSRVRDMALMFSGCSALTDLRVGNGWTAAGAGNLLAEFPRAMQDDTGSVWKAGAVVPDGAAGYQALADDASTAQVDERLRAVRR